MKYLRVIDLLALLFFLTCTTKEGRILEFQPQVGNILVNSTNFFGARIFLDYEDTGKQTPALLKNVRVGRHVLHLFLSKHKPTPDSVVVFLEEGQQLNVSFELNKIASGDLEVTTQPDSARVRINKLNFGFTPLTVIGLPSGSYRVQLTKGSYLPVEEVLEIQDNQVASINRSLTLQRMVLLEHFSNTGCPPCPEADAIIEQVLGEIHPELVTSIGYHPSFPDRNDPMYLAVQEDNDARWQYYGSPPLPRIFVDGKLLSFNSFPELEQKLRNELQNRLSIPPQSVAVEILDHCLTGNEIRGRVKVTAFAELPAEARLRIALIERVIDYEQPPGSNGQKHFIDVFRGFSPSADGHIVNLQPGEHQNFYYQFTRQSDWSDNLAVVALVQDDATRAIWQSAWTVYP